ncbi:hypothetical protein ACE3MZ_19755 [Paenibacillus sp. WLX1005]|uniref:hypothetical protein n=1 Tax=Paenibacillus sp. WLX1005 TaxID=3243766 RepID=UPI003984550F
MVEQEFEKAIDISLSRWDELNAIRGLYMCEHAELEFLLRNKFACFNDEETYKKLVNRLRRTLTPHFKSKNKKLFDAWEDLIKFRNLLAHTSEGYDNERGFYIQSGIDENIVIYEDTLDEHRLNLKELKAKKKLYY